MLFFHLFYVYKANGLKSRRGGRLPHMKREEQGMLYQWLQEIKERNHGEHATRDIH